MTEKEKQIEEMREIVSTQRRICHGIECAECDYRGSFGSDCIDERNIAAFYAAGYRKQSEVAKEFVDRLILELIALRSEEFDGKDLAINGKTYKYLVMRAKEIAAEYGVEVEK